MKHKLPTEIYYGFHEVSPYAMDYLFIDYLETLGLDKEEVQKLRLTKDFYLQDLANETIARIKNQLVMKKGLVYLKKFTPKDIMDVLNPTIVKKLLEV